TVLKPRSRSGQKREPSACRHRTERTGRPAWGGGRRPQHDQHHGSETKDPRIRRNGQSGSQQASKEGGQQGDGGGGQPGSGRRGAHGTPASRGSALSEIRHEATVSRRWNVPMSTGLPPARRVPFAQPSPVRAKGAGEPRRNRTARPLMPRTDSGRRGD